MKNLLSFLILSFIICSCSAASRFESVSNKFLEDVDVSKKIETMPFQHSAVWQPPLDRSIYTSIYIEPIKTDLLSNSGWESSISAVVSSKEEYLKLANELAGFFRDQLIKKFNEYPQAAVKVMDSPIGPGIIIMSLSLTELEFSHPLAQAGALAAPVPGAGAALGAVSTPHVAIAMRITENGLGRLVATAADRKFPPTRLVDLNKLTVTSSAREVCENWAIEIVDAMNKGRLGKVESSGTFSILPW